MNKKITSRNRVMTLMALYDAVETGPGQWRPYTLEEIGNHFGITRERVRQIINVTGDPYPLHPEPSCKEEATLQKSIGSPETQSSTHRLQVRSQERQSQT